VQSKISVIAHAWAINVCKRALADSLDAKGTSRSWVSLYASIKVTDRGGRLTNDLFESDSSDGSDGDAVAISLTGYLALQGRDAVLAHRPD